VPLVRFGAMLSAVLFLLLLLNARGIRPRFGRDTGLWKGLIRQSYPVLASQFLIIVMYQFSVIVLGLLGRTEEIGYFSAVQKMVLFFIGLAGVFWAVVFPTTANLYVRSREELRAFEERVSKVICAVAVPVGLLGFVLAEPVIGFLYGDGYARSAEVLKVMIWIAMFALINGIFAQGLLATGGQKLFLRTVGVQTVLNVCLVFLLVPKFGGVGGAASWLSAEAVGFFLYKRYYSRAVRFGFYRYLVKPLLASMVAVLALGYFGSLNVFIAIASGAFLYLGAMVFMKGIEIRELRMVYQSIWKA
jgi:O-antigen/teichoic acid export membrane protein